MKKLWMIGVGVIALSVAGAMAQGGDKQDRAAKHERKGPHAKPELKELSFEGVIQKAEHKKKDGTTIASFKLVTDAGTEVMLPAATAGADTPAAKLAGLAGSRVKVVGDGYEMERGGKKRVGLKTIKSVEKVVPVEAPAP